MTEPSVRPTPSEARSTGSAWLVTVAAVVVVADQLTKTWALRVLDGRTIDVVGSLRLRLVHNTGSAFSLASGLGPLLAVVGVVVVLVLLRAGRDVQGRPGRAALGLVLGGALGNLGDRALRDGGGFLGGAVVDFVDLQWWPVFNVADVAITVGAVVLAFIVGRQTDEVTAGGPAQEHGG